VPGKKNGSLLSAAAFISPGSLIGAGGKKRLITQRCSIYPAWVPTALLSNELLSSPAPVEWHC
jgi:hypothetical protein